MKIIPMPVKSFMSSTKTAEFIENTVYAVSVETALKMIGRPIFIMMDKEADSSEKKKYAAVKELLYQGLCFSLYVSLMTPVKNFIYKIISKNLRNNPDNKLKIDEFNLRQKQLHHLEEVNKEILAQAKNKIERTKFKKENYEKILRFKDSIHGNKNLALGKGIKELSAIIGSVLMLTIVAPQISHFIIHPIMEGLNMEQHKKADKQNSINKKV
jgi:hypothetical protein